MRTLFWQIMTSLDGFMEGPGGELDWHVGSAGFDHHVAAMLDSIDTIVLGRRTYDALGSYWPTADAPEAATMNALPKLVCSRSRLELWWNNARLVGPDPGAELAALKREPGRSIGLFGSADLAVTLHRLGLIDEYRILINPLILGHGRPAFARGFDRSGLRLIERNVLDSGVVALHYARSG